MAEVTVPTCFSQSLSQECREIVPHVHLAFKPRGGWVCPCIYFNKLLVSSKDVVTGTIAAVQLQGSVVEDCLSHV